MSRRKTKKLKKGFTNIVLLAVALLASIILQELPDEDEEVVIPDGDFQVHFIDVGQGDCSLVVCDGQTLLIDGGESENAEVIENYLKQQNIEKLDYLVATHHHSDHIGSFARIVSDVPIGGAYISPEVTSTMTCESFLQALDDREVPTWTPDIGQTFSLGSAKCMFLSDGAGFNDINNSSIALKVSYGEFSVIFTGDIETEAEKQILKNGLDLKATMLSVAHHGSSTSSCQEFLDAVSPEAAVISLGKDNKYGHPHKETMARLEKMGLEIYRTDMLGDIVFTSDGRSFEYLGEQ